MTFNDFLYKFGHVMLMFLNLYQISFYTYKIVGELKKHESYYNKKMLKSIL